MLESWSGGYVINSKENKLVGSLCMIYASDLGNMPLLIVLIQGIGNSIATWQPCFVVLSGLYLYVLESEKSQSYQRYSRSAFILLF